jgi:hypothetical protein
MYGYTMHFPAPIDAYRTMHKAVMEVLDEEGGGEGLLLHVAYPTDQGFDQTEVWESKEHFDAFTREVLPKAMSRAGMPLEGPPPAPDEFTPAAVITRGAFNSDAAG